MLLVFVRNAPADNLRVCPVPSDARNKWYRLNDRTRPKVQASYRLPLPPGITAYSGRSPKLPALVINYKGRGSKACCSVGKVLPKGNPSRNPRRAIAVNRVVGGQPCRRCRENIHLKKSKSCASRALSSPLALKYTRSVSVFSHPPRSAIVFRLAPSR